MSGHYACLPQRFDGFLHIGEGRLWRHVIHFREGGSRLFGSLASLQLLVDERSSIVEIQCPAIYLTTLSFFSTTTQTTQTTMLAQARKPCVRFASYLGCFGCR
jgi:hypothetical protein